MTMQQINNNPQTPLEKLISDKRRIKRQCIIQKQKLMMIFIYTRTCRELVALWCNIFIIFQFQI